MITLVSESCSICSLCGKHGKLQIFKVRLLDFVVYILPLIWPDSYDPEFAMNVDKVRLLKLVVICLLPPQTPNNTTD